MVLNAGFNELVFENRHKKYGAYEIRRRYRRNVLLSAFVASSIFAAGMVTYVMNLPEAMATEPPRSGPTVSVVVDVTPQDEEKKVTDRKVIVTPPPKGPDVSQQMTPQVTLDSVAPAASNDSAGTSSKGVPGGTGSVVTNTPCIDCDTIGTGGTPPPKPPVVYCSNPPECKGLDDFFLKNIKYPQAAKDANIEGTVWLEFIVDSKGNVSEIKIAKGVHPLLDKEVMRVAPKMPEWTGGSDNGEPVDFLFRKPVRFALSK
jgi:periplasmic protein TonB